MKSFTRDASVSWLGTHQHGKGAITTQSDVLKNAPCVSGMRVERASGTNPPELIAAAHAGSFSMTLASELAKAGYCPDQIDTTATVTMEDLPTAWTITPLPLDLHSPLPHSAQHDITAP